LRILPVVKAYPVVDQVSFSEAVCVAGITVEAPHRWIRLFPLDYRGLERAQQFRKYEITELDVVKSAKDSRPESYAPVLESIEIVEHISTDNGTGNAGSLTSTPLPTTRCAGFNVVNSRLVSRSGCSAQLTSQP
jgi:hypothetical protein